MLACVLWAPLSHASEAKMAIILDDLGDDYPRDIRALQLPGQVTYAILPHTPYSVVLAEQAHAAGKEVILHLPMSSQRGHNPGPGSLSSQMPQAEFIRKLQGNLNALPHIQGLNNHMGSALTQDSRAMRWLMDALAQTPLYFVDSKTTPNSVAEQAAQARNIPTLGRDIFLDRTRTRDAVDAQFKRLIHMAQRHGFALAIGHPYPATLASLNHYLPQLTRYGIQLVSVSDVVGLNQTTLAQSQPLRPAP